MLTGALIMRRVGASLPLLPFLLVGLNLLGCRTPPLGRPAGGDFTAKGTDNLVLAAYSAPQEAFHRGVIPAFQAYWLQKSGRGVVVEEHYEASTTQAQKVVQGLEADVVALSSEPDVAAIENAGLITHDWKSAPLGGFVTTSVPIIGFRAGNPKQLSDWQDLTKPGVSIICPDPRTSGMGQWAVASIYGAGLRRSAARTGKPDPDSARDLLQRIAKNIVAMPASARDALTAFQEGKADALITYEHEALLMRLEGKAFPFTIPTDVISMQNPAALVDRYVDRHGNRELAQAFVEFLGTEEAQRAFAQFGFRPVKPELVTEFAGKYPKPAGLFDISYLGGWLEVYKTLLGPDGLWQQIAPRSPPRPTG